MLRKTAVIVTMLLCSMATQVYALGLGSVAVESALNQPLRMRIEILQLGNTRLQDVTVQMASVDDFQRANIERLGFLSNIRFSVEATTQGNYVTLTSNQIVREPYLSFILETRWPNGRLLTQHTILLDLPVFDDRQPSASVRQPISPVLRAPDTAQPVQPFVEPSPQDVVPPVAPPVITPPVTAPPILEPQPTEELTTPPTELADQPQPVIEATEPEPPTQAPVVEQPIAAVEPEAEPVAEPEAVIEEEPAVAELVTEPEEVIEPQIALEEPAEEVDEAEVDETEVDEAIEPEPEVAVDASVEPDPTDAEPETIETTTADTLSDIALRVRPDSSVSMQQTMVAIQQLNPDAFDDGNINRLRSGEILRVPSLAEIQSVDPREAIDEVNRQNQQFAEADVEPLASPADDIAAPQDDQQQGQLSVVTADADAIDASSGAGVLNDAENAEMDRRIAELENQLALQQEEADRARIQREELDSRMQEMESQITAAQEIIQLQDLQLAQLQESLAQAAAEAAETAAVLAAAQAEAEQPVASPTSLLDDVLRILTGNTLMMIFGIVLVISLLVFLLLRRNRAAKTEDDELDELAEKEFDDAADEGGDKPDAVEAVSDLQDSEAADLDSELDDIIGEGDEPKAGKAAADESSDEAAGDSLSQADAFIQNKQLDQAVSILRSALEAAPEDAELGLKLLEVLAEQGDLSAFEVQADQLSSLNDAALDAQADDLRASFAAAGELEVADEFDLGDEEPTEDAAEPESSETVSFLDDLGIDLDAFDEDETAAVDLDLEAEDDTAAMTSEAEDEVQIEDEQEVEAETGSEDSSTSDAAEDSFEPDEMGMTFDLGGEVDHASAQHEETETEAAEPAEVESEGSDDELDALEFSVEEPATDAAPGASEDTEESAIESLKFDADTKEKTEPEATAEEDEAIEMETVSFDTDIADSEKEASTEESAETVSDYEENAVDFEKAEIKADVVEDKAAAEDEDADLQTFDFDLEAGTATTVVEKAEATDAAKSADDIEEVSFDLDALELKDADAETGEVAAVDDQAVEDFDFDLDKGTAETDAGSDQADVGIDPGEEAEKAIDEAAEEVQEVAEGEDNLDDLEFLSEEDEVEIESVTDIEDVEMLSDDDEVATKLELAYAYHKMGDVDGAKEILKEVIDEGSEEQIKEANKLLSSLDNPEE